MDATAFRAAGSLSARRSSAFLVLVVAGRSLATKVVSALFFSNFLRTFGGKAASASARTFLPLRAFAAASLAFGLSSAFFSAPMFLIAS